MKITASKSVLLSAAFGSAIVSWFIAPAYGILSHISASLADLSAIGLPIAGIAISLIGLVNRRTRSLLFVFPLIMSGVSLALILLGIGFPVQN